jgi:hypothetical protein
MENVDQKVEKGFTQFGVGIDVLEISNGRRVRRPRKRPEDLEGIHGKKSKQDGELPGKFTPAQAHVGLSVSLLMTPID